VLCGPIRLSGYPVRSSGWREHRIPILVPLASLQNTLIVTNSFGSCQLPCAVNGDAERGARCQWRPVSRYAFDKQGDRVPDTTRPFARVIQSYMVFGTTFDVDVRYTVVDAVGQGAYGIVW
jgi:hypothetical protein